MLKILFILKKELLLLIRDIPGLIILFAMPVLLIFVVTIAQQNALKNQATKTEVLLVDEAKTALSEKLCDNLDSSGFFTTVKVFDNKPLTRITAHQLIRDGKYKFGVLIPSPGNPIEILIDPTIQDGFQATVTNSLRYIIKGTQTKESMNTIIGDLPGNMQPIVREMISQSLGNQQAVHESYAQRDKASIQPNVIQNNIPGFILFAMFFIVIPLSGSLITEKNEGSFLRLKSLPVGLTMILGGKVLIYLIVCVIQFMLMLFIGTYFFPTFLGMKGLVIGDQYFAIAVATVAASFAAVGFGVLVGSAASTHSQAGIFGSVMVVMLGVISGTFFPVHLMPDAVKFISLFSPVRWGIDNYLILFVREGDILSILSNSILLMLFFGLAITISIATFAKQK